MVKIDWGGLIFNPFENGIGKVVPDRDSKGKLIDQEGRKKDSIFFEGAKICHPEYGTRSLAREGFHFYYVIGFRHSYSILKWL